ncbi:DegV family protein [Fictibacillus iocasae]|uniref:DegV family protein n=1 Tax=Fictibacillus iocasae TaxID=2715437 RepID=A0ABW2NS59_9BACL
MKFSFVLDSASDYRIDPIEGYPLAIVPLNVQFGDDHYLDGVNISENEFYNRMGAENELPKTSQPSPQSFLDTFQNQIDQGYDVFYLGISSNLSGTVQSATLAKSMLKEEDQNRVHIFETGTASGGVHVLYEKAVALAKEGKNTDEIASVLSEDKKSLTAYVLLETLENLKKGGRISAVQGAIADFLNIKPLISIHDGVVETVAKFRGRKKGVSKLNEMIQEWRSQNPDKKLFIIHSLPSKEEVLKEFSDTLNLESFKDVSFTRFGSTIGTYSGVNAIGYIHY